MRSFRKLWMPAAGLLLLFPILHADLANWVQNLAVETGLRSVFFRPMPLPDGNIDGRRPPAETRKALGEHIAASPKDALLYRLRAGEDELALDFPAAEIDWKTCATLSGDATALADYYDRRLQIPQELATQDAIATTKAFERAIQLANDQGLPVASVMAQYRAWIAKFPQDAELAKRYIQYLTDHAQFAGAEAEIQAYRKAFPEDESIWIEDVGLTMKRGTVDQAIAVFDQAFRPLMPEVWLKSYFDLLDGQGRLRDFLSKARAAAIAQPENLDPVARQFYYYRSQKNEAAARRVLLEYRARKKNWTSAELYDTAELFDAIEQWDEAARQFYALYSLPSADDAARERGLTGLIQLLFSAPEQPVHFGSGDLSLYKDIGTMDPHPGFLNGILSLVLNGESPRNEYDRRNQAAVGYFHRVRAAQLLDLLDTRFPQSKESAGLHTDLIGVYATYGDDDGVVRAGRKFLSAYPKSYERYTVAMAMADALARQRKTTEEMAVYDNLLKDLAADPKMKSEYTVALDRYIARLVALDRNSDALAAFRHEIDRNPQDQTLYEKLAAFLEQHGMGTQVEQVYKEAAAKFPDSGWQQKLARWYLRLRRNQDYADLTRQVVKIFSGTALESYFREVGTPASLDAALYRQVNLYAHERFPDNLTFVKNLIHAYSQRATADPAALTALYRSYWFYDAGMRREFFEGMARAGTLDRELAALQKTDARTNPIAAQFLAEGEAWRGHFEQAAAPMRTLAAEFPGDTSLGLRASTLERSLGRTDNAVALARNLSAAVPRDSEALARIGDTLSDREWYSRARPYWDRIPRIEPGKPEGYLEAATIFWDYYLYDDALGQIGDARTRFHQPALYAYEAGAIYEGKRDYPSAVRQYARGAGEASPARDRLLVLAANPKYGAIVDSATASAPLNLRVAVLEAEKRYSELEALLKRAAATETTAAALDFIGQTAGHWGYAAIQESAVERQVAISHDPIERIRLRLDLMRLEESHGAVAAARQTVEAVLRENPTSLGVVRAATDFYWRHQLTGEAVATLTAAAGKANDSYRAQFTYEAARKSTTARQFTEARNLLAPLLTADPFNAQYLAAMADTYGQANDDTGLRDFYTAAIDRMKQAPLAAEERTARIAGLRRGLIPALTRLGKFSDATDQYVELINRYPEDQGLIHEAAAYAERNNLVARLRDYYAKAATDSPKDYRWPMVTAHLETNFENFDAAVTAYSAAIKIRPDRVDLYSGRGELEERLMRFADAEKTYSAIWELSYRDARWLDKVAELEARQRKPDAVGATLQKAYLEGRPERADLLLDVARKLESWDLIPQALEFARRAAAHGLEKEDTRTYARILTRARQSTVVLDGLFDDSAAQMATAEAIARYYTPEEKAAFAADLGKRLGDQPDRFWMSMTHQAGLLDLEASLFRNADARNGEIYGLIQLQNSRMRFDDLGREIEALAAKSTDNAIRTNYLAQAAEAYTSGGDTASLARIFTQIPETRRFLEIVSRGDPSKLLRWAEQRDDAADLAVASGNTSVALQALGERGRARTPIWNRAYTALTSLYYWSSAPDARGVFQQALGGGTIGERLGQTVNHDEQLAGSVWFYYGARYGEYLSLKNERGSEDYLAAELEASPGRAGAYSDLADWFVERGQADRAFTEYDHALELDPGRGEVQGRIALLYWDQGKHAEAIAHWKLAIADFEAQQGRPNLVESFWPQAKAALTHIGQHGVAADLRPAVDSLLRAYVARHAGYNLQPLLAPTAEYRLVDFSTAPFELLQQVSDNHSLKLALADQIAVLRRLLYLNQQRPAAERNEWAVDMWEQALAGLLIDAGDLAGARAVLAAVPDTAAHDRWRGGAFLELQLRIAAKSGELANVLAGYGRNPQDAPDFDALRTIAEQFANRHEDATADQILAFAYGRELDTGNFQAGNFLGLAQIRLKAGDLAGAQQLLHRMQLISGQPFEELMPAGNLLVKFDHPAEAAEYFQQRVRAVPWDAEARLRVGSDLNAIAADETAPYGIRVEAAKRGGTGGSGELALLARGHITPAEANRPFYYEARLEAARSTTDLAARAQLLLDAIAVNPDLPGPMLPLFQAAWRSGQFQLASEAAQRVQPYPTEPDAARELSSAFERAGNYSAARSVLEGAARSASNAQIAGQLKQEAAAVERHEQIHAENEARRPHVTASIEQDHVVRPRVEK